MIGVYSVLRGKIDWYFQIDIVDSIEYPLKSL